MPTQEWLEQLNLGQSSVSTRPQLNRILLIHNQTELARAVSALEARKSAHMAAEAYIWYFERAMSRVTQPTGMIAG